MELPLSYHSDMCCDCSDEETKPEPPPVAISKTIANALAPSSIWHPVFWPIIIEQATECQRWRCLRQVNRFFASIDRRIISDNAKEYYFCEYYQQFVNRFPKSVGLKLDRHGDDWASWGFGKTSFDTMDNFLRFCELADVDLDTGVFSFNRYAERKRKDDYKLPPGSDLTIYWVFVSRSRDLLFETGRFNPLNDIEHVDDEESACYIRDFGITGAADKVKRLLEYAVAEIGMGVTWGERDYI